jgi:hypothetical protein
MWVFLKDAFMSIVEDLDNPDLLLVRARFSGDIENVFPDVDEDYGSDYKYRAWVHRLNVADAMYKQVVDISYDNFKDRVHISDPKRAATYGGVWAQMFNAQNKSNPIIYNRGSYNEFPKVSEGNKTKEYYEELFGVGKTRNEGPSTRVQSGVRNKKSKRIDRKRLADFRRLPRVS